MADWIDDGESGASVRAKLNTIGNDGTSAIGFQQDVDGNWLAENPNEAGGITLKTADGPVVGDILLQGGDSDTVVGGNVEAYGGNGAEGGCLTLKSGSATNDDGSGNGGDSVFEGGAGTIGRGGNASVSGGNSAGAEGGGVYLNGGLGGTNGGEIGIYAGDGDGGTGTGGNITLQVGTGDNNGHLFFVNIPGGDPGIPGAVYLDGMTGALKISL